MLYKLNDKDTRKIINVLVEEGEIEIDKIGTIAVSRYHQKHYMWGRKGKVVEMARGCFKLAQSLKAKLK